MTSFDIDVKDLIGKGIYPDPVSCLDAFHEGAATADMSKYFGCFSSVKSRFLGTDASENWTAEEFFRYAYPHFKCGKGWTYVPRRDSRKIDIIYNEAVESQVSLPSNPSLEGNVFGAFATFDELLDNSAFGTCRGSGSLIFSAQRNTWLIVAYHLSFPVPNDVAKDICSKIIAFEKGAQENEAIKASEKAAAELLAELDLDDKKGGGGGGGKKSKSGGKKR